MSAEEDTELRDLVAQTLENNGILGKIKAQLRASIFLALEEQNSKENKIPLVNKELKDFLNTKEGLLAANVVKEFLEYFNLEFTQTVFDPETSLDTHYNYKGRQYLSNEFSIVGDGKEIGPILGALIRKHSSVYNETKGISLPMELSSQQLASAEMKYQLYKADGNGLSNDDVCDIFMEIFPNFRRKLIEQFVSDELFSLGKHFPHDISCEEFLSLYEKFFSLCRSVMMHDSVPFTHNKNPNTGGQIGSEEMKKNIDVPDEKGGGDGTQALKPNDEAATLFDEKTNKSLQNDESDHDDSFFDEPLSNNVKNSFLSSNPMNASYDNDFVSGLLGNDNINLSAEITPLNKTYDFKDNSLVTLTRGGGLGSLKDAPPLTPAKDLQVSNWKDWEAIDKQIADIGLDVAGDDDYEEDFQLSLSARSDRKSGTDPSADEEIEEDISGTADDLLNSSVSGADDLTTDKTVSQISGASVDYLESLN